MSEALPRQFGDYQLIRRLGVGGMAETFVAQRLVLNQVVCLKRVLPAYNNDPDFVQQFQREARLAGRLRHSNIVGVIDFGTVGKELFLALELVEGVDLRALINGSPLGRLPHDIVALLTLDLAYALAYAHDEGVVHRDVTPSNVLLSVRGELKLADFGVAKNVGGGTAATASGFIKGKVPYMAPEQMKGAKDMDGRADLFSVGVSLYEMLAGHRPFVGTHDVEIMMKIIQGERQPLLAVAPDVPPALAAIVERLLAIHVGERVSSAHELVDLIAPMVRQGARQELAQMVRAAYALLEVRPADPYGTELQSPPPPVVEATPTPPIGTPRPASGALAFPATNTPNLDIPRTDSHPIRVDRGDPTTPQRALGGPQSGTAPLAIAEEKPERSVGTAAWLSVGGFAALMLVAGFWFRSNSDAEAEPTQGIVSERPTGTTQPVQARTNAANTNAANTNAANTNAANTNAANTNAANTNAANTNAANTNAANTSPAAVVPSGMRETPRTTAEQLAAAPAMRTEVEEPVAMTVTTTMTTMADSERPRAEERSGRARVRIFVVPWGEVWIDDRYMGRAPIDTELALGRHMIAGGVGEPRVRRRITLDEAGSTTRVELSLE